MPDNINYERSAAVSVHECLWACRCVIMERVQACTAPCDFHHSSTPTAQELGNSALVRWQQVLVFAAMRSESVCLEQLSKARNDCSASKVLLPTSSS